MNILSITHIYSIKDRLKEKIKGIASGGGEGEIAEKLCYNLAISGHKVHVILPFFYEKLIRSHKNIFFYFCKTDKIDSPFDRAFSFDDRYCNPFLCHGIVKALKLLQENQIDIILTQHGVGGYLGYILKDYTKVPNVLMLHGILDYCPPDPKKAQNRTSIPLMPLHLLERLRYWDEVQLNGADLIIAPSKIIKEKCLRNYNVAAEKIVVIPFPVSIPHFSSKFIDITRRKYNIGDSKKTILTVGLMPHKGVHLLINAVSKMREKGYVPPFKILAVGDVKCVKNYVNLLKQQAEKARINIIFTGFIPRKEVFALYHLSDCFISLSCGEALGFAVLEAAICGLPLVIPQKNIGAVELLKGQENIFLLDDLSINSIGNTLEQILDLKVLRTNRKKLRDELSWNNFLEKFLKVVNVLI